MQENRGLPRLVRAAIVVLAIAVSATAPARAQCTPDLVGSLDTMDAAYDVAVSGTLRYVADGFSGLQVIDVSDPTTPMVLGAFDTSGFAQGVAVSGTICYVADGLPGLRVIDVSDPATPMLLGTFDTADNARDVAISGTIAYVADGLAGLQVIDVADPTMPMLLGTFDTTNIANGVTVSGTRCFVADQGAGLHVIDVSDPTMPALLGTYDTPDVALDVAVSGTIAYVADQSAGLQVIDVSDPTMPALLGALDTTGLASGVAVSGTIVYVADFDAGLQVIDAANPAMPTLLGTLDTSGSARRVALSGTVASVADDAAGLQVVDASSCAEPGVPCDPALLGTLATPNFARGVAVAGTTAYVTDAVAGLQVIDVAIPAAPVLLGALGTPTPARRVAVSGTMAYITHDGTGLLVIDVTDPTSPTLLGSIGTSAAVGVAVSGTTAYVADQSAGLRVIDVSDPATPALLGTFDTADNARDVAISGTIAYVADGSSGLQVIDVTDPTTPVLLGTLDTSGFARDVAVSGSTAYVADNTAGLRVIDVADPANPVLLGTLATLQARGVAVSGTTAYVADQLAGLRAIDVSDPTMPVLLGTLANFEALGVAVNGATAYAAGGFAGGLLVIDLTCGACCFCDGTCLELAESACLAMNDVRAFTPGSTCMEVTCEPTPPPVILGPAEICPNANDVAFEVETPIPGATYAWSIDNANAVIDGSATGASVRVDAANVCNASFTITVACTDGPCTVTGSRTILVDVTDPTITTPAMDLTVECDGAGNTAELTAWLASNGGAMATDACSAVTWTNDFTMVSDGCGETGTATVTFTAADACNNAMTTATFTIQDTTPPAIVCPDDLFVSCAEGPPPSDSGVVTASDGCGGVVVTHVGDSGPQQGCPRTILRTYRATDDCGLISDCTQRIHVDRIHPGWNWVDNAITLTANEPAYWSALTGEPKGVSPFTVLDPDFPPGRPATDGSDDRVLRGYVIAWAVDQFGDEIRWNHLKGEGTIVHYGDASSWEYNTWNHAAVANVDHGAPLPEPGVLRLDGLEYSLSFDELLLNFQAARSDGFSAPIAAGYAVESDSDLTLFPPAADLRQNSDGPVTTKASMDIWNENETKFSGMHRCITCWDQELISRYDAPNSFLYPFLQTDHGKARIDGHAADACDVLDDPDTPEDESVTSIDSPLLGVYARHLEINGVNAASSGSNLVGLGTDDTAVIRYDAAGGGGPPEGQMPDDPAKLIDRLVRLAERDAKRPRLDTTRGIAANEPTALLGLPQDRVSGTEKGSLLLFSKVELRWGGPPEFPLLQDTFLSITNDFPEDVRVQMYFVNGDAPITATPAGP